MVCSKNYLLARWLKPEVVNASACCRFIVQM
jgi:hypothetical protein